MIPYSFSGLEPFFYFLVKASLFFGDSYLILFSFSSFIICFFYCISLRKESAIVCALMIVIILFLYSMVGVRQSISIAVALYVSVLIKECKYIKAFFFSFIAIGFHYSSFLLVFLLLVSLLPLSKSGYLFLTILAVAIISKVNVIEFVFNSSFFMSTKYSAYSNSELLDGAGIGAGVVAKLLLSIFFVSFFKKTNTHFYRFLFSCNCFYIVSFFLMTDASIFYRFVTFLQFVPVITYTYLFSIRKSDFCWFFVLFSFFVIYLVLFFFQIDFQMNDSAGGYMVYPYKTYLF